MGEVQQEFLVTETIQEIEVTREIDINFVGVYITAEDKVSWVCKIYIKFNSISLFAVLANRHVNSFQLPIEYYQSAMNFHRKNERTIFIFICDVETLTFCQESFGEQVKDAAGDARILRKSIDVFDFALMASCNATIISNEVGVLHALLSGGETTVHKPEITEEPDYYVPWLISEQMANWYAIDWHHPNRSSSSHQRNATSNKDSFEALRHW